MIKFLFTSLFAVPAFAQPAVPKYTIKQVIAVEHQVVAEASYNSDLKPGKIFLATFEDGSQCALSLKSVNKKNLTFDSSTCKKEDQLTLKTPIEPALTDNATAAAPVATAPAAAEEKPPLDNPVTRFNKSLYDGRFGITLSYSHSSEMSYTDPELQQGGTKSDGKDGDIDFDEESAVGIGVSYARMRPHEWGFSGSLLYEFPRKLRPHEVNFESNGTFSTAVNSPKLSVLLIEANLLYRWDFIYVPFGLNISVPFLENKDTMSARPGIGLYAGLGLLFTEDIGLELFVRSVGVNIRDNDPVNHVTMRLDQTNAFGAGASLKYWF